MDLSISKKMIKSRNINMNEIKSYRETLYGVTIIETSGTVFAIDTEVFKGLKKENEKW